MMVWGGEFQLRLRILAGEGKLVGGYRNPWGVLQCKLPDPGEGRDFMLARAPLRPGEEERKTEIETAGREGEDLGRQGGRHQGQRHQRITGQEAPSPK